MSDHVEGLFSAAYDGELSGDARAAFDRHLAECSACAAAFAQLSTAADALRELGPARMPRPVRLPEGAPIPQRRLVRLPARPSWGRGLVAGLTAAGMVAVAGGIAAVVIVTRPNSGVVSRGSASYAEGGGALPAGAVNVPAAGNPATCAGEACSAAVPAPSPTPASEHASVTCPAELQDTSAAAAAQPPAGFSNHVTQDNGTTTVVIATQAASFPPGQTVDIYARVIDDATGAVWLPCAYLAGPEAGPSSGAEAAGGGTTAATPVAGLNVGGVPVVEVVVPKLAVSGEAYEVVVEGLSGVGEVQPQQVSLSIEVT
ncbi:MAG: anti-sigma factor family protein [Candidatus Dormibacteria bacterium]